jgi:[ribosomal protein S5]-alanine N-acetyltransferase
MKQQPTLQTDRLVLRPFTLADASAVQRLAGAFEVADTTLLIPHPYEDGVAEQWISSHASQWEKREGVVFAIALRQPDALCGAMGLKLALPHLTGELGYWIGLPFWRRGYCTEAAREILRFGFQALELNRIHAYHFRRNPASRRVLQKIGMLHEGCLRQHVRRWDRFEDVECYGILRQDWERLANQSA